MLEKQTFVCYNGFGDSMKIDEIKKTKSGKYKVKIDGTVITTYDDVILDHHLLYQKEISPETLEEINKDTFHSEQYHKALAYALRKVRSVYEMKKYMEKLEMSPNEIEKNISHLKRIGILSDVSFVKAYLSDSLYLSNDGPYKMKQELLDQEIEESLIEEEMSKIDLEYVREKLIKSIYKKLKNDKKHSSYQLKQKIILDMVNLGYDRDMIMEILSDVSIIDQDKLEREYEKLYEKLKRKYEGKELFRKIQEKLYSKGFDIHDIQNLIDKKKSEDF